MDNGWTAGSLATYLSLPRECLGFERTASDEDVRIFCQEIFSEIVHKPCATLEWCPYGVMCRPVATGSIQLEAEAPTTCCISCSTCPAYGLAEPWMDPLADRPDDEEAVTLCCDCYEELLQAAGKSEH